MSNLREYWRGESIYGRFETVVSLVLVGTMALLVVITTAQLVYAVVSEFPVTLDGLTVANVQGIFGLVLTVLIALEFARSIVESLTTPHVIVQSRAIILIAILTVVRKLILLDLEELEPLVLVGLAALIVALGILYWFVVTGSGRRSGEG